jgi:hypothetical protein
MSAAIYVAVGAGAGALLGAGAGYTMFKKGKKKSTVKHTKAADKAISLTDAKASKPVGTAINPTATPVADKKVTSAKPTLDNIKHEKKVVDKPVESTLFDAQVTYLTRASEFYTPLVRFEIYLQAPQERKSFTRAVEHIDHFLGMDALLNGRAPVSRGALPTIAQSARNKTLRIMDDIIEFSFEDRASPTKREAMQEIRNELANIMDEMISDMLKLVAANTI